MTMPCIRHLVGCSCGLLCAPAAAARPLGRPRLHRCDRDGSERRPPLTPLRALPRPCCASLRSARGVLGRRHARALETPHGRCLAGSPRCPGRWSLLPPVACPPPVFSTRSPSVLIGYRPSLSSHSPPITHSVPVSEFVQHVVPPAVRRQHPCAAEWLPLSVPSIGPTALLTLTVVVAVVVCPWSIPISTPPYPPHGASRPRARCGLLTLTLGAPPVAVVPFSPHRVPSGARGGDGVAARGACARSAPVRCPLLEVPRPPPALSAAACDVPPLVPSRVVGDLSCARGGGGEGGRSWRPRGFSYRVPGWLLCCLFFLRLFWCCLCVPPAFHRAAKKPGGCDGENKPTAEKSTDACRQPRHPGGAGRVPRQRPTPRQVGHATPP